MWVSLIKELINAQLLQIKNFRRGKNFNKSLQQNYEQIALKEGAFFAVLLIQLLRLLSWRDICIEILPSLNFNEIIQGNSELFEKSKLFVRFDSA